MVSNNIPQYCYELFVSKRQDLSDECNLQSVQFSLGLYEKEKDALRVMRVIRNNNKGTYLNFSLEQRSNPRYINPDDKQFKEMIF